MVIYEIINKGKGIIAEITPDNLLLIENDNSSQSIFHNELEGLNVGDYQHLTASQLDRVLDLIYLNNTSTIITSPTFGERGRATSVNVLFEINSNDDNFISASINQGIGNVLPLINLGPQTISAGNLVNNTTFTLSMSYNRDGVILNENKSTNYNAYIPQWIGVSDDNALTTYSEFTDNLEKFVQSSPNISRVLSPNDEYIWFVSTANISSSSTLKIRDVNDFVQTVGNWNDGVSEFYKQSINLTLFDNTTTANVFLYRSRQTKTLTNFTYKIS